ncbi:RHS domain-containing protein [Kosakonia sacchari]|uniref:RHS repeat domain-containing protein n=1 Tax=Kosakonia sacchari TaxID=1158459 RepID=UPI002ACF31DE|nr:RHS domain-containing protein [Kosakonia sacchari]
MTERHDSHRGTVQRFSYDDEHRISQAIIEGDAEFTRAEYRYDALGRRTEKQVWRRHTRNAERMQYAWSGLQMVGECSDSNPDAAVQYIYTENGYEPLARIDSRGGHAEVYWYHTELNGLPEKVTDSSGDVVWQGVSTTRGRSERESSNADWDVPQNLRFQGQYLDRETGLHYNTFRYYDPCGGRYTQMNPIGLLGGLNTYTSVVDPLGWVDPWGLAVCSVRKVNGTKIYGTGQVDKTPGHNQFSEVITNKLAMSGKFKEVYLNRSYSFANGKGISARRPDVMAIDINGRVHSIELASKTHMGRKLPTLTSRNETAMSNLPVTKQGEIIVFEHPYNASEIKSMLDNLISGI